MDQLFITTYIEKMSIRLTDSIKNEIMLQTQLELAQQLVVELQKENEELKSQVEKINKKKKPEVDTSTF